MTDDRHHPVTVRHTLRPGDLGHLTAIHGILYAEEYGFDHTFEAYVAATLAEFGQGARPERDRLWIAERDGHIVGSIGIVGREAGAAQLRWLLVHPTGRGQGLGRRLVRDALTFCGDAGYDSVYLWTVRTLTAAARLYQTAGFRKTEERAQTQWGTTVTEERYDLKL